MKWALQDEQEAIRRRRENSPKKQTPTLMKSPINNAGLSVSLLKSAQKKEPSKLSLSQTLVTNPLLSYDKLF